MKTINCEQNIFTAQVNYCCSSRHDKTCDTADKSDAGTGVFLHILKLLEESCGHEIVGGQLGQQISLHKTPL